MKLYGGTYFGIPLYFHWTWFAFLLFILFMNGWANFIIMIVVFLFVILHEYGHCLMAKLLKLSVKDVTMIPFGGVARIYFRHDRPKEELLIALAGPFVNLLLANFFFILMIFSANTFLVDLFWINVILACFNLLVAAFPMDGGRVLRSCLTLLLKDYLLATRLSVRISQALSFALIILGIWFGQGFLCFIFVIMILAAQGELMAARRWALIQEVKQNIILENPELIHATLPEVIEALQGKDEDLDLALKKMNADEWF